MNPSSPFSYTWTPASSPAKVATSRTELTHIGIAYAVLTADLLILFSGGGLLGFNGGARLIESFSPGILGVAAAAALTGFLLHEIAHKVAAERRGFWAEFRMSPMGLLLSIVTAFFGFLWAAPGATVVGGMSQLDARNWGRTSLAGPLTNAGFCAAFYAGALAAVLYVPVATSAFLLLAFLNAWFGTFNLIPLGPLDGRKVLRWSPPVWVGALGLTAGLAALSGLAYIVYGTPYLAW